MRPIVIVAMLASSLCAASAMAADQGGRYMMSPSGEGFARLDTETGVIAMCRPEGTELACKAASDDTLKLQAEIDRLTNENLALTEELEQARIAGAVAGNAAAPTLKLPSEAEVDKAMSFVEKLIRRFKALVDDLNRDNGRTMPL